MKKKTQCSNALDDMFSEDEKKRFSAIKMIKQIAVAIGPLKVRTQFIPYLTQFIDDEPNIMLAVLDELTNITHMLGGSEYEKSILPLLTSFCKLDEKEVAFKSLSIMEPILEKNPDEYLQIIRKLSKANMNVSKECGAKLIVSGVKLVPHLEATFLEIFNSFIFSENASIRIIAVKYLKNLAEKVKNQEQIMKIVELIFNDSEDLVKLLCIDTLIILYKPNPNLVMNKLKYLFSLNTWRINLKLCQMSNKFSQILSKTHFKILIEPAYLKLLATDDDQIRSAACQTLVPLSKNMTQEEMNSKLLPILKKLATDKVEFVRNQFSNSLVRMAPHITNDQVKEIMLPLVMELLKDNKLELSYGLLNNFEIFSEHLSDQKQESWLFQPLKTQLQSGSSWRLKSKIIQILGKIVLKQKKVSQPIVKFFCNFIEDKVQAVRNQSGMAIIQIIKRNSSNECDCQVLPEIQKLKNHPSYLIRQKVLMIIEKSLQFCSNKYISEYRKILTSYLGDPIPNIKLKALKIVGDNRKICDKAMEKEIERNKDDTDTEVQRAAKQLKI